MTPAEHYARADELLAEAGTIWETQVKPQLDEGTMFNVGEMQAIIASFQVRAASALAHATLALYREVDDPDA